MGIDTTLTMTLTGLSSIVFGAMILCVVSYFVGKYRAQNNSEVSRKTNDALEYCERWAVNHGCIPLLDKNHSEFHLHHNEYRYIFSCWESHPTKAPLTWIYSLSKYRIGEENVLIATQLRSLHPPQKMLPSLPNILIKANRDLYIYDHRRPPIKSPIDALKEFDPMFDLLWEEIE